MVALDLFAGAGGMSLGAQMAGITVKTAVEKDEHACSTYRHNHPDTKILEKDIREVSKIKFCNSENESVIVFGGPPCRGFSTSNQKTRNKENSYNWLFKEFIRITKLVNPDWLVLENVKGIVNTANGDFLKEIKKSFSELGYSLDTWLLNAEEFGVPQKRTRFFLVGNRTGKFPTKPKGNTQQLISVIEAFEDLPKLKNGSRLDELPYKSEPKSNYSKQIRNGCKFSKNNLVTRNADYIIERYKHIPQGGNWENIPENLMSNYKDQARCHSGIYYRLKETEPSIVIGNYRKNMLIHPTENRGLSVREAARIQSFPDEYEFKGSIGKQQQQVGNAVPPLLAKAVFKAILSAE